MRSVIAMFCFIALSHGYSQGKKDERESRLKKKDVPASILESLGDILPESKRAKFYSETDGNKKSIEAKLMFEGKRYSIEFSQEGQLEDIEVLLPFTSIATDIKNEIEAYFDTYDKYHLDKAQKQFSDPSGENKSVIRRAIREEKAHTIRYEIEVSIKSEGKWKSYEVLFSDEGQFISKRVIIHRSTEFIIYQ